MNKIRLNTYSKKKLNFAPFEQPYRSTSTYNYLDSIILSSRDIAKIISHYIQIKSTVMICSVSE